MLPLLKLEHMQPPVNVYVLKEQTYNYTSQIDTTGKKNNTGNQLLQEREREKASKQERETGREREREFSGGCAHVCGGASSRCPSLPGRERGRERAREREFSTKYVNGKKFSRSLQSPIKYGVPSGRGISHIPRALWKKSSVSGGKCTVQPGRVRAQGGRGRRPLLAVWRRREKIGRARRKSAFLAR